MRRVALGSAVVLACLSLATGCGGGGSAARSRSGSLPAVVLSSPEAPEWVRLLRSSGFAARTGSLAELLVRSAGVVPGDARLSGADVDRLVRWVEQGGRLATQDTALLRALRGRHGRGAVVSFEVDPLGHGRQGWELDPRTGELVGSGLRLPPGPRLHAAQIFVDPGGLRAELRRSPDRIAALLTRAGARVAEVAAWDDDFTKPADDYDYAGLLRALHARGILAFAWLEPPFVTLRLWQQHPECRERTATGRDARVDWRDLIALENARCLALAEASWRHVLTSFPWDGVDVAELYFEPPTPRRNYTPFSPAALRLFGRDPAAEPAGFAAFRTRLVTTLNRTVLAFVSSLPGAQHRGLELTVIDDTLDPELGRGVGSDVAALARVAAHAGASLIVEDPHTTWGDGPLRYDRLGPHVAKLMPAGGSLLDVNVVPRYAPHASTSQMTGAELALAVGSATASAGRVALYSLGTLTSRDLEAIPSAAAASTATTDLGVYGRWTVTVTAPAASDRRLDVDGIAWPAAAGRAVVPGGNHVLAWHAGPSRGPGLVAFTGQLGSARVAARRLELRYDTRPDGLAVVDERPVSLTVDGRAAPLAVVRDPAGGWVVRLPAGTHDAEVRF